MGYVYLYTGNGAGKTTNALGLALRVIGHGKRVLVIQFMKWKKDTGEYLFKHPNYMICQYGRDGWHGEKNLINKDKELALQALNSAYIEGRYNEWDLIIFDEINYTVHCGLLKNSQVIKTIKGIMDYKPNLNIVMTGRHASKTLIRFADFVNEIVEVKNPKMVCEEGIQW